MIFWIIACGSTEKETSSINVTPEEEAPIEVIDEEVGQSDLEESTVQSGRSMKRMTIAQIRDSMEQIRVKISEIRNEIDKRISPHKWLSKS